MKKYKIIFIFTVILCLFFNIGVNFSKHMNVPSEGWSRNLKVNEYIIDHHSSATYEKKLDSLRIYNEIPYYIYLEGNTITMKKFDTDFTNSDQVISFTIDNEIIHSIDFSIISNNSFYFYILDDKKNLLTYSYDGNSIIKADENFDITYFKVKNKSLYYIQSGDLYKNSDLFKKDISGKFDILDDVDNTYVLYIDKSSTNNKINIFSTENNSIVNVYSLPKTPNISIRNVYLNTYDNKIDVLIQLSNSNNSETTIKHFSYDKYFPGNIKKLDDTKLYSYNNSIQPFNNKILLSDADENFGNYPNIFIANLNENTNTRLTISKKIKFNIMYFELGKYKYLKWNEFNDNSIVTNIASDNSVIINSSLKMNSEKYIDIIMKSLSSYLPLFYLILIPFTGVFIPVVIFIMIMSMFNLGKLENNVGKTLISVLIIHNIAKSIFFVRNVILNNDFILSLPEFLQNYTFVISFFLLLLILGILFIYTLRKEEPNFHFFKYYIYYMIFDVLTFSMILYSNFA